MCFEFLCLTDWLSADGDAAQGAVAGATPSKRRQGSVAQSKAEAAWLPAGSGKKGSKRGTANALGVKRVTVKKTKSKKGKKGT